MFIPSGVLAFCGLILIIIFSAGLFVGSIEDAPGCGCIFGIIFLAAVLAFFLATTSFLYNWAISYAIN